MKIYMAPMEGLSGYILRNAQNKYFGGVDKFFTPFIPTNPKGVLGAKYKRDILPENNEGINLVPQIIADCAQDFIAVCRTLEDYGYTEFNLNLGCPSGTVVSKGRGAGFLKYTDKLDAFLYDIFSSDLQISVKTRTGYESNDEFCALLEIFNKYPIKELIIHPRTGKEKYSGKPDYNAYRYAAANSRNKLCYNGDIFTPDGFESFMKEFPDSECIMLGRGLVYNPALASMIKSEGSLEKDQLYAYYKEIYAGYEKILSGGSQLAHRMKEILLYMVRIFEDSKKAEKKIKKAKNIKELDEAVNELFTLYELKKY